MDRITPEYREVPGKEVFDVVSKAPAGERLVMVVKGTTIEGEDVRKTVAVNLGPASSDARRRLADAGLQIAPLGDNVQIAAVKFGSRAKKAGIDQGFDVDAVKVRADRPSAHWFYLPALLLLALVWWTQGRRMKVHAKGAPVSAGA